MADYNTTSPNIITHKLHKIKRKKSKYGAKISQLQHSSSNIVIMYWTKCTHKYQRSPMQTECNYFKRLGHFLITIGGKTISWLNFSEPPVSSPECSKHRRATAKYVCELWTVPQGKGVSAMCLSGFSPQHWLCFLGGQQKNEMYICQSFADFYPFPRCDCKGFFENNWVQHL